MRNEQKNEEKERKNSTVASDIATQYFSNVKNNNASSNQLNTLAEELKQFGDVRAKCTPESTGGYAAEIHHQRTFLADAAKKGHNNLDVKLGPRGGRCSKGTADLMIIENGKPVAEAGLKYRGKETNTAFDQSNAFDRGRQKICPDEQVDRVKELANTRAKTGTLKAKEYADTAKNATNKLKYKDVESKPLTKEESIKLVNNSSSYAKEALKNDLTTYSKTGAITGAMFNGATSIISNTISFVKGQKEFGEAVKDIAVDTTKGGVKGATVGVTTAVVKQGLIKVGAKNLARGSVPVAIATSAFEATIDIAKDIKKLSNGQMKGREVAFNAVGHTASAATKGAGSYAGAQIGATLGVFAGPVGVAVGGLIGGTIGYLSSDKAVGSLKPLIG